MARAYAFSPAAAKGQVVEVLSGLVGHGALQREAVRVKLLRPLPVARIPVRTLNTFRRLGCSKLGQLLHHQESSKLACNIPGDHNAYGRRFGKTPT